MTVKPWDGESALEYCRHLTHRLRHAADDDPGFQRLRRGLTGWGLDPARSVLGEHFGDGGSDFGIVIRPDGVPCAVDVWWGAEDKPKAGVEVRPLDAGRREWAAHGRAIYAGWVLHMEEGRSRQDLLSALVPGIAHITSTFRSGDLRGSAASPYYRDWSLAEAQIAGEGWAPERALRIAGADSGGLVTATFALPDRRVFAFVAEGDEDRHPKRLVEWRELSAPEIVDWCGPLYDAAVRILEEEAAAAPGA